MIELKFNITFDETRVPDDIGKVSALVRAFNSYLNLTQSAGSFEYLINGDKKFVIFVSDWLEAGSQTCFAWTSEDRNDVKGFLESLAKFPQIFCKVVPVLTNL